MKGVETILSSIRSGKPGRKRVEKSINMDYN
jgi:hypothetical protein